MNEGFSAQDGAVAAIEAFKASVIGAYKRPEVREAGALNLEMPTIQQPIPRQLFPGWK